MSRNSSGTYTLPSGNPVVTGTVITSTWGNTTMTDIANALTDSLSRTGLGGMQAGLPLFDGTSGLPGLAWGTELTSGMYRAGVGDFRWVVSTTELLQLTTNLFRVSGTAPVIRLNETDAAANNRLWDVIASGEDLFFRALTDALVATNWMTVSRTAGVVDSIALAATAVTIAGNLAITSNTIPALRLNANNVQFILDEVDASVNNRLWRINASGEQLIFDLVNDGISSATTWLLVDRTALTVDTINFPNGTLQYGGVEVGFRILQQGSTFSNSVALSSGDSAKLIFYTGTGGHSITLGNLTNNMIVMLSNIGSGNLTITATGVVSWSNGSGSVPTGNRTLAVGGLVTLWHSGSGNWTVWGIGIS